jgi:hypothetical protein
MFNTYPVIGKSLAAGAIHFTVIVDVVDYTRVGTAGVFGTSPYAI